MYVYNNNNINNKVYSSNEDQKHAHIYAEKKTLQTIIIRLRLECCIKL